MDAKQDRLFQDIFETAHNAGMRAVDKLTVTPMVVSQHTDMLNDNSPIAKQYFVPDGVCGFAWVNVKPGNSAFAKWLLANDKARKDSYFGGVTIWVSQFEQSMQRKEAYAQAFADVLTEVGIKAYSDSRMD